jgi:hypothetical protein
MPITRSGILCWLLLEAGFCVNTPTKIPVFYGLDTHHHSEHLFFQPRCPGHLINDISSDRIVSDHVFRTEFCSQDVLPPFSAYQTTPISRGPTTKIEAYLEVAFRPFQDYLTSWQSTRALRNCPMLSWGHCHCLLPGVSRLLTRGPPHRLVRADQLTCSEMSLTIRLRCVTSHKSDDIKLPFVLRSQVRSCYKIT